MAPSQKAIRNWLDAELKARGRGAKSALAKHMGVRPDVVTRILNAGGPDEKEERGIDGVELLQMQEFFGSAPPGTSHHRMIKVVGYVAAGEAIFDAEECEIDEIEGPVDAPPKTVAVEIRGDSLGAAFDRWYAFYTDRRDPFTTDLLNQLCVIGTADGRTVIKTVRQGRKGLNLHSGTGAVEENVKVIWGARVIQIKPKPVYGPEYIFAIIAILS